MRALRKRFKDPKNLEWSAYFTDLGREFRAAIGFYGWVGHWVLTKYCLYWWSQLFLWEINWSHYRSCYVSANGDPKWWVLNGLQFNQADMLTFMGTVGGKIPYQYLIGKYDCLLVLIHFVPEKISCFLVFCSAISSVVDCMLEVNVKFMPMNTPRSFGQGSKCRIE